MIRILVVNLRLVLDIPRGNEVKVYVHVLFLVNDTGSELVNLHKSARLGKDITTAVGAVEKHVFLLHHTVFPDALAIGKQIFQVGETVVYACGLSLRVGKERRVVSVEVGESDV